MASQRSVIFAEPVRTAIGTFGGSLKDVPHGRRIGLGFLPHDREHVFHLSRCHLTPQTQSFEPPSTWMVSPVIQRASCEARNATTEPTSSG
jgi:hypothetical protein